MGTSRRRTPPGARLAGPRGHPDRLPRQAKNEQIAVWFQVGSREFVRTRSIALREGVGSLAKGQFRCSKFCRAAARQHGHFVLELILGHQEAIFERSLDGVAERADAPME